MDEQTGRPRSPRAGMPVSVIVAGLSWFVLAALLVAAAVGGASTDAPDESVGRIRGALGAGAVAGGGGGGGSVPGLLLFGLAAALLLLTVGLLLGRGWVLWPLALVGVAAVIALALGGSWQTLVAMVLVALGTVGLLFGGARRHLEAPEPVS